jgi:hypothetical protein
MSKSVIHIVKVNKVWQMHHLEQYMRQIEDEIECCPQDSKRERKLQKKIRWIRRKMDECG